MVGKMTFCKVTSEETVNGLCPLYIAIWIRKVMINHWVLGWFGSSLFSPKHPADYPALYQLFFWESTWYGFWPSYFCGYSTCAMVSSGFRLPPMGPRWFHDAGPSGHLLAADLSTTEGLYYHNRATDSVPLYVASPTDAQCDTWSWVDGCFPKMDLVQGLLGQSGTFCSVFFPT